MKTLDEVIKTFECCYRHGEDPKCDECPYNFKTCGVEYALCGDVRYDALHYLKEYRDMVEKLTKAIVDAYEYIKPLIEEETNPAMTWDELKQMDEQPIWVEVYQGERAWFLVFVDPDDDEKIFGIDAYGAKRQFNKNLWTNGTVKGYRNGRYKTD